MQKPTQPDRADLGIMPERSIARRLNREMFLLLCGNAALLMQVAHPLVAAGVDQHSDFRRDPIGRLRRTLDTTLTVVFGTEAEVRRALGRIDRRHRTVVGHASDGRPYIARDPRLLLWVQATLVLTSLRLYELVAGRLSDEEREAYWEEAKPIAMELGIPARMLPATLADLEDYERETLARDVWPDDTSRAVGRAVLRPLAWLPGLLHWPFDALTARLLPARLRADFHLRYGPRERLASQALVTGIRLVRPFVPDFLAVVPHARRYEHRRRSSVPSERETGGPAAGALRHRRR